LSSCLTVTCCVKAGIGYRFVLCYRPPGYVLASETVDLFKNIRTYCTNTDHVNIVLGDFNLPGVNWSSMEGLVQGCSEIIAESSLVQLIDFPTMDFGVSLNTNDLLFSSSPQYVTTIEKGSPFGPSNHCRLNFNLYIENTKRNETIDQSLPKIDYLKGNYHEINMSLSNLNWNLLYRIEDLNEAYGEFCRMVLSSVYLHCPKLRKKKLVVHKTPAGMRTKYKKKKFMYKNIRTSRDRAKYKAFASQCASETKQFYDKIESNAAENKDNFYGYLRSRMKQKSDIISMKNEDGFIVTDKNTIVEMFTEYFSSVYSDQTTVDGSSEIPPPPILPSATRRTACFRNQC
jgi:hypothetical protein